MIGSGSDFVLGLAPSLALAIQPYRYYFGVSGRSGRSEYLSFTILYISIYTILTLIGVIGLATSNYSIGYVSPLVFASAILIIFFTFGSIVPLTTVTVRRLHDLDRPWWWIFLCYFPLIYPLSVIALALLKGALGANRYGDELDAAPAL